MGPAWAAALRRAADYLGRRRSIASDDEEVVEESGFTLIELMVVLLIMGILMAIAIPTFLGVTSTANDRSTQSNLVNVMTSAKALYAQAGGYKTTTKVATALTKDEPEFSYTTGASTTQNKISVWSNGTATRTPPNGTILVIAAWMTKTKICWVAKDNEVSTGTSKAGVRYGYATVAQTACTASTSMGGHATHTGWPAAPTGK